MKIWIDTDMGGDDAWLIVMAIGANKQNQESPLLARHQEQDISIEGISTVYGNTDIENATKNACDLLTFLKADDIPIFAGAAGPIDNSQVFGDNAFGEEGFCGIKLSAQWRAPITQPNSTPASEALAQKLRLSKEKITILAAGPATNLALLIEKYPQIAKNKIERIILMSGGIEPGPDPVPKTRTGNITEFAEFNAFQDPTALNIVFESGIPCDVIPLDLGHQMPLNEFWQSKFSDEFNAMTKFTEHLDKKNYGTTGAIVHDANLIAWAVAPNLFQKPKDYEIYVDESPAEINDLKNRRGMYNATELQSGNHHSIRVVTDFIEQHNVLSLWAELFNQGISSSTKPATPTGQMQYPALQSICL